MIVENPGMAGILVSPASGNSFEAFFLTARPEFPQDFPETQAGQQEAASQAGRACLSNRGKNHLLHMSCSF